MLRLTIARRHKSSPENRNRPPHSRVQNLAVRDNDHSMPLSPASFVSADGDAPLSRVSRWRSSGAALLLCEISRFRRSNAGLATEWLSVLRFVVRKARWTGVASPIQGRHPKAAQFNRCVDARLDSPHRIQLLVVQQIAPSSYKRPPLGGGKAKEDPPNGARDAWGASALLRQREGAHRALIDAQARRSRVRRSAR